MVEKIQEIDLRALLVDHLKCDYKDMYPLDTNDDKIVIGERYFEPNRKWTKVEKSNYIESLYLGCFSGLIVRFIGNTTTYIVDGLNRWNTIKEYCSRKLVLNPKGIKQLDFLKNHILEDEGTRDYYYFMNNVTLKVLDFRVDEDFYKELSINKEIEICRYLHILYNTNIRLELEEMQKAEYSNDLLTKKIKEKLQDKDFLEKIENLKLFNGKKKNKIENILVNCRLLIASTYTNINSYVNAPNTETRINEAYQYHINFQDKEEVFNDFVLNVELINEKLINTQVWQNNLIMNTRPFLDATYWLISVIRKEKLFDPNNFDFMQYLKYFSAREENELNFTVVNSHYKSNILKKYLKVAEYVKEYYGINLDKYFCKENKEELKGVKSISTLEELIDKKTNFCFQEIQVRTLLNQVADSKYLIQPYYQRNEVMDISKSSRLIESLLLGIKLPHILLYERKDMVTEVVDGQQRIKTIIAFLNQEFKNEKGELEKSLKNNFALKDLLIYRNLNGYKGSNKGQNEKDKFLNSNYVKNILDAKLYIVKTREVDDDNFSAIDHFIRLNKSICTIKENSYRMWCLTSDMYIINMEKKITKKYLDILFAKSNSKRADIITLKYANLFYHNETSAINIQNFNSKRVTAWLKKFDDYKNKFINTNDEGINELRNKYISSLKQTDEFYQKFTEFLESINKNIRELFCLNEKGNVTLINYYYIFCLLVDIPKLDLLKNKDKIAKIIVEFFQKVKDLNNNKVEIIKKLEYAKKQIAIYDNFQRNNFKQSLSNFMVNI